MGRDFTYIDDIIEGVVRVINRPATANGSWNASAPDPATSSEPYRIYNIGSSSPVRLMDYIETLEFLPMQPGDVLNTYCDVSDLEKEFGYRPSTTLKEGLKAFAEWYKSAKSETRFYKDQRHLLLVTRISMSYVAGMVKGTKNYFFE